MAFQRLTTKKATSLTPQLVTLVVDDSGSMDGQKAADATKGVRDLVITMQSLNQGASATRFFVNIAKFGSSTIPLVEAVRPEAVSLSQLTFTGNSGTTEMPEALAWAAQALQKALDECRKIPKYIDESSPNPLVLFFSDGKNTGGDVGAAAQALKSIPFTGGSVDVVAVGIGMSQEDFAVMKRIASKPELAVNIDPSELAEFLAQVGATMQTAGQITGQDAEKLIKQFD